MKIVKLGDLSIGEGSYGIAAPACNYSNELPTYLRITDIKDDGTLDLSNKKSVNDLRAHEFLLRKNDIVFARTGASTGRNYFYDKRDGELVFAGFLIKFSINPSIINPRYLKYYCQTKNYYDWVASFNSGSTRGNINARTYEKMPIIVPERKMQDLIVKIADSISDKMRANSRINDYLVQMTYAVYTHYKNSSCTSVALEDAAESIITGKTPSTKCKNYYGEKIPFITIPDMHSQTFLLKSERYLSPEGNISQAKKLVPANSVLVSCIATVGLIGITAAPSQFNQQINAIIPREERHSYWLFHACADIKDTLLAIGAGGSATLNVNRSSFSQVEIKWPSKTTMDEYLEIISPLFEQIKELERERLALAELRDTLLPKLMSGEIDISKIDVTQLNNHLPDSLY